VIINDLTTIQNAVGRAMHMMILLYSSFS